MMFRAFRTMRNSRTRSFVNGGRVGRGGTPNASQPAPGVARDTTISMVPLFLIFVVGGLLAAALLVWFVAISLVRPSRMNDGKALALLGRLTPDDIAIGYERVTFQVSGLTIAGWWMPAAGGDAVTTVVLIHGFADAKVGAIAWAPIFHTAGLNCLAIDLRAHGESGGKYCTLGEREAEDVGQVINELRAARSTQTRNVVVFGASMGGVTALRLAATRDDLAGVIADSPVREFPHGHRNPFAKARAAPVRLCNVWRSAWRRGSPALARVTRRRRSSCGQRDVRCSSFFPIRTSSSRRGSVKS